MTDSAWALFDLVVSHRVTAVIYVAARLGIADAIVEGAKTPSEIAQRTGADEHAMRRLLRTMVTIGLCRAADEERFELTELGAPLAETANPSLKAWATFEGEMLWSDWGGLLDTIRSGKTKAELAGVNDSFDDMARRPERVKVFNEAMVNNARMAMPGVVAAYDFSKIGRWMDVGGGFGQLLSGIVHAYPSIHGVVFDLARCEEGAKKQLARANVADRCEFIAGDFFRMVPSGADAIILKSVIHDWDNERSVTILRNCRQSLPKDGRLLLIERLMPEVPEHNPQHLSHALSDLNMLRGTGGSERTESEYGALLTASGFRPSRALPGVPAGRFNIIEAVVA